MRLTEKSKTDKMLNYKEYSTPNDTTREYIYKYFFAIFSDLKSQHYTYRDS